MTLKAGLGVTRVIENDTIRSGTHDFLLTFHSNHRPKSHRFRINGDNSPPRVFCALAEGVTLGIGYRRMGQKTTRMMELPEGQKSFMIGLVV